MPALLFGRGLIRASRPPRLRVWVLAAVAAAVLGASAVGSDSQAHGDGAGQGGPAPADVRLAHWHEDLDALAEGIEKKHKNAFFKTSPETFRAAVAELHQRLPELQDHEIVVAFMQIAALIGDGHTSVDSNAAGVPFHAYPFWVYQFRDGIFITHAAEDHQDLLRCRIMGIDDTPIDEAAKRVSTVFPFENESWRKHTLRNFLGIAEVLHAVGVAKQVNTIQLRLRDEQNSERLAAITPIPPGPSPKIIGALEHRKHELPITRQKRDEWYWQQLLPESNALYCRYEKCADQPGSSVKQFSHEVLRTLENADIARLIIDLRNNGGGNSSLLWPLIEGLAQRKKLEKHEMLYVLIGRGTFSSGQLNAWQLRRDAGALVFGEPTGQKPNAYGEVRTFTLPHSGLTVTYSTKHFQTDPDDPPSMEPDVKIEMTSAEYFAGRDPVLEAVLAHESTGQDSSTPKSESE